jgi:hypothetical protein
MANLGDFDRKMEEIANVIADRILGNEPVDKELTDTFKALSGYQASSRKLDKVLSADEDHRGGFSGIRARIAAAGKDGAKDEAA